ncbi:MAG: radical SAM protein [Promethearchaeota archaeon]
MRYEEVTVKTVLGKEHPHVDSWFWLSRSMNLYRGCQHNCIYCDGKAEYYRVDNFSTYIRVKINAPQVLRQQLQQEGYVSNKQKSLFDYLDQNSDKPKTKKPKFILGLGGGVCDAYQPAEAKYKLSREVLKIALEFEFPIFILTKNKRVLRDLDLLKQINEQSYANVSFSITLSKDELQKIWEPKASSTTERFEALKTFRGEGIHGGVFAMPLLPGIGDTEENIRTLVEKAKNAKAEFFVPAGLTLKPERQKNEFIEVLKKEKPELLELYHEIYGQNNIYGHPDTRKTVNVIKLGHEILKDYGIPNRVPRYIPEGRIKSNLRVAEHLFQLDYMATYIHGWKQKAQALNRAANSVDRLSQDITTLSAEDMMNLGIEQWIIPEITTFLQTGSSELWQQLF